MEGSHACLCPKLLHVWSVGRPADCSDCSSEDACGGATFGASRGLLVTMDDGSEQSECVCQCTRLFSGLSCNVSLTKHLPVSPEAGVGITLGTVAAIGVVMWRLLGSKQMGEMDETKAKRMLFIEFADFALDWVTFGLAFYAADLRFHNDPDHIMRDFIMTLCVLSTVSWVLETMLFCTCAKKRSLKSRASASTLPTSWSRMARTAGRAVLLHCGQRQRKLRYRGQLHAGNHPHRSGHPVLDLLPRKGCRAVQRAARR